MVFWLRSNAERLYKSLSIWLQLLLFFFLAWHFITTSIIVEYVSGIQPVLHYHRNTTNMLTEFSFRFCFSQSTFYNRGSFSKIINSFSLFFWTADVWQNMLPTKKCTQPPPHQCHQATLADVATMNFTMTNCYKGKSLSLPMRPPDNMKSLVTRFQWHHPTPSNFLPCILRPARPNQAYFH